MHDFDISLHIEEAYDLDLKSLQEEKFHNFIRLLLFNSDKLVKMEENTTYYAVPLAPIKDHAEGGDVMADDL